MINIVILNLCVDLGRDGKVFFCFVFWWMMNLNVKVGDMLFFKNIGLVFNKFY